MSTLQKAILKLNEMPESDVETVYAFINFVSNSHASDDAEKHASAFGIAHKYANPDLIDKEKEAFSNAMERKHALG